MTVVLYKAAVPLEPGGVIILKRGFSGCWAAGRAANPQTFWLTAVNCWPNSHMQVQGKLDCQPQDWPKLSTPFDIDQLPPHFNTIRVAYTAFAVFFNSGIVYHEHRMIQYERRSYHAPENRQ